MAKGNPMNEFVVFYHGKACVVIKNVPTHVLPTDVLRDYSKHSGFTLSDLTWAAVNKLDWNEMDVETKHN
jgi:hypothetical protein